MRYTHIKFETETWAKLRNFYFTAEIVLSLDIVYTFLIDYETLALQDAGNGCSGVVGTFLCPLRVMLGDYKYVLRLDCVVNTKPAVSFCLIVGWCPIHSLLTIEYYSLVSECKNRLNLTWIYLQVRLLNSQNFIKYLSLSLHLFQCHSLNIFTFLFYLYTLTASG